MAGLDGPSVLLYASEGIGVCVLNWDWKSRWLFHVEGLSGWWLQVVALSGWWLNMAGSAERVSTSELETL